MEHEGVYLVLIYPRPVITYDEKGHALSFRSTPHFSIVPQSATQTYLKHSTYHVVDRAANYGPLFTKHRRILGK